VRSRDYDYFCSEKPFDFGPLTTSGAVAVRSPSAGRLIIYEVLKGGGIEFRLGQLRDTASGAQLAQSWILLTRKRKLRLKFPDITQSGNVITFRSAEMAATVGYEINLRKAN